MSYPDGYSRPHGMGSEDPITIRCPVSECEYRDTLASVAAHMSGKRDAAHTWSRLGYRGANEFKRVVDSQHELVVNEVPCPVTTCNYHGEPPSVAGHVSGKKDRLHDWNRLGYDGAWDFRHSVSDQPQDSTTTILHMTDSHIGKGRGGFYGSGWSVDCAEGFEKAIHTAVSLNVDAVVHTGDLFHNDRHGITDSHRAVCEEQLEELRTAGISFHYILGDHERDAGANILEAYVEAGLANNLSDAPTPVGGNVALYGQNFLPKNDWTAARWNPDPPKNRTAVLGLHQTVTPFAKASNADVSLHQILEWSKASGNFSFDIILLGQLHRDIDTELNGTRVICGGATARLGRTRSSIDPSVGFFEIASGRIEYSRVSL